MGLLGAGGSAPPRQIGAGEEIAHAEIEDAREEKK
jgi:hypothetical protein